MKKKVSPVVSEAGVYLSLMTELNRRVLSRGGTFADWHRLVKPEGEPKLDQIADLMVRPNNMERLGDSCNLLIKPAPLAKLIECCNLDHVNSDINEEHFPINKSDFGRFSMYWVHFDEQMYTPDVLGFLEKEGLIPGRLVQLLGLGAFAPNLQREFPIIALGSSWVNPRGSSNVPALGSFGDARARYLRLSWDDYRWYAHCRFLALSK
ncbi:hypothetical protein ACFL0Z_00845 [Patescibacteria group bacterium]